MPNIQRDFCLALGSITAAALYVQTATAQAESPQTVASQVVSGPTAPRPKMLILVPCPAGSPTDISARAIVRWWSDNSGRDYYVENLPGRTNSYDMVVVGQALADQNSIIDLGECTYDATVPE